MIKYGVQCSCPTKRDPQFLEKTASGDERCTQCGRTYATVVVREKIAFAEKSKVEEKPAK